MPYEFPRDKVLPLPAPPVVKAQPLLDPDTLGKRSTNVACAIVYASILLHYVRAEALALAASIVSAPRASTRSSPPPSSSSTSSCGRAATPGRAATSTSTTTPRTVGGASWWSARRRARARGSSSTLALKGHHLVAADASLEALKTVCDDEAWLEDNLTMVELDVRDAAAWEREVGAAAAAPGGLDALINVAAMPLALHAADAAADAAALGAVAASVALGTAAAARRMASQPTGGHVLNVATLGALAPAAECALSHAAAAAARAYSVAAAKDLAPKGVRVTALITDAVRAGARGHVWRDEVATGFVGGTISPEQFELAAARALLRRPVEMRCAASPLRALRVVVANALPGCLLVDGLIASSTAAPATPPRRRSCASASRTTRRRCRCDGPPLLPPPPPPPLPPPFPPHLLPPSPLQRLNAPEAAPRRQDPPRRNEGGGGAHARALIWVRRRLVGAYGWKAALAALAAAAAADGALLGRRDEFVGAALAVCALLARVPAAVAGAVVDGSRWSFCGFIRSHHPRLHAPPPQYRAP